ncbi:hypothetical protein BDW59DRAFT_150378, partial [Aspergillus cavernicola]
MWQFSTSRESYTIKTTVAPIQIRIIRVPIRSVVVKTVTRHEETSRFIWRIFMGGKLYRGGFQRLVGNFYNRIRFGFPVQTKLSPFAQHGVSRLITYPGNMWDRELGDDDPVCPYPRLINRSDVQCPPWDSCLPDHLRISHGSRIKCGKLHFPLSSSSPSRK